MADFDIKIKETEGVNVITTNGYLNNYGGEQVASVCLQKISEGKRKFLINEVIRYTFLKNITFQMFLGDLQKLL